MIVRTTQEGNVMLIMCFYYEDAESRTALLDAVADAFPQITSLYYVINGKANDSISDQECVLYKGEDAIYEYMEGLKFKIGPNSFYQTNTKQAYNSIAWHANLLILPALKWFMIFIQEQEQ